MRVSRHRPALCADAALAPARLAALTDPERTGLRPFLAEEHAAFSPQAARAAAAMVPLLRTVLACELVAAEQVIDGLAAG
jgi:histidine ammonia-lyase